MSIFVAAVIGPTASGKTALSVELAKMLGGEIVSADSMQIYRGMDIATAKPSVEEKQGIAHHLMDFLSPGQSFSVAEFCSLAKEAVSKIDSRGHLPIIAGGTGLYIDSFLSDIDFAKTESDPSLRQKLSDEMERIGVDGMLEKLRSFDPDSYERLKVQRNPKRIIRCMEVYLLTGVTQTQSNIDSKRDRSPYECVKIGLKTVDRQYLYDRIDRRVDEMLKNGLLEEAKKFFESEVSDTAAMAIGYKELKPYFDSALSLAECVDNLKRATRRYAKRQLTWFSRDPMIHWFTIDTMSFDEILSGSYEIIRNQYSLWKKQEKEEK